MWAELAMAAALATAAECPPTADGSILPSSDPDWLIKPSSDDIWWAYPPKARAEESPGRATIRCELNAEGVPEKCEAISEEPAGYGFGEAAVSLASRMRFRPLIRCGKAERGEVRIPISFALPDDKPNSSSLPADDPRVVAAWGLAEALRASDLLERDIEHEALRAVFNGREPSADERKAMYQAYAETKHVLREKLLGSVVQTLARMLSLAELEQATTFFETPTGSKIGWGGEVFLQAIKDANALKPNPFIHVQRRFCELSPASCEAEKP